MTIILDLRCRASVYLLSVLMCPSAQRPGHSHGTEKLGLMITIGTELVKTPPLSVATLLSRGMMSIVSEEQICIGLYEGPRCHGYGRNIWHARLFVSAAGRLPLATVDYHYQCHNTCPHNLRRGSGLSAYGPCSAPLQ
ncbi:hypothetical protein BV20DRAFT_693399 [Pilatotrama ljubarskyi]|nr:hypothetical protein BV20DRAFT_693399 [Pilatotrama ljubarskyi]